MHISRELNLKVIKGFDTTYYFLGEDVTILTKDDTVIQGEIIGIYDWALTVRNDANYYRVNFDSIEKIVNTEWLGDSDIKEE